MLMKGEFQKIKVDVLVLIVFVVLVVLLLSLITNSSHLPFNVK